MLVNNTNSRLLFGQLIPFHLGCWARAMGDEHLSDTLRLVLLGLLLGQGQLNTTFTLVGVVVMQDFLLLSSAKIQVLVS